MFWPILLPFLLTIHVIPSSGGIIKRQIPIVKTSICDPNVPCGWEVYDRRYRIGVKLLYWQDSPCECEEGTICKKFTWNNSNYTFEFRCRLSNATSSWDSWK